MKATLSEIERDFVLLTPEVQVAIKGGKGIKLSDDDLKELFDYTGAGGFNSLASKNWNHQIRALAATDAGASLLRSLKGYSNEKINLTTTAASNPGSYAEYNYSTNTLHMGVFSSVDFSSNIQNAETLKGAAHEMYHAFQDMFWNSLGAGNTNVSVELDAYMFESQVLRQSDALNHTNLYSLRGFGANINNPSVNGGPEFQAAWKAIIENGVFTLESYNTLIANFKNTGFGNNSFYNYLTTTPKTSISQVEINQILWNNGDMILKWVPGNDPVISPYVPIVLPLDPNDPEWGVNWDDSTPFDNPFFWGYDPGLDTFDEWYETNTEDYTGDTMPEMEIENPNGGGYGDDYVNNTTYTQEWINPDTGGYYYLAPGQTAPEGFQFNHSGDINNPGGYDEWGCNPEGYGTDGRDSNGFDRDGYDENGFDRFGFNENGFDTDGYDENGFDVTGFDAEGYNEWGEDEFGFTREENGDY